LDGKRNLSIPKGTESGDILKVRGEGFPRLRGSGRGDELVHIIIKTPRDLTKRQEEILHEFEGLEKKKGEEGGVRKLFRMSN
jgi:molecular chaperone DnaJ